MAKLMSKYIKKINLLFLHELILNAFTANVLLRKHQETNTKY